MKKILLFASALAFFAASCQQENLEPVVSGNTVTYTVQVADAVGTKAIGDLVPSDMVLHYEVYRTTVKDDSTLGDGTRLLYHKSEPMNSNPFTINLELVNDQNFTVLFWAQTADNTVIDPSNLRNVTVSQSLTANQANYAAFSNVDFIEKDEQLGNRTISLVRPVSQINLGTTPESLKSFKTPITMSESSFTVNGLSTSFNVATQEAGAISAEAFTFGSAAVPTYDAADSLSVNGDNYAYAAMNYVGFAPKAGVNVVVSYEITTSEGKIDNTIENVPVKPNYRTNIVGNLITEGAKYQVSLDANWAGVSNVVCTAADLKTAIENAENGSEVVLSGDIDLNDLLNLFTKAQATPAPTTINIAEGKSVVLNLNGYTLTQTVDYAGHSMFVNNGTLTLKGEGTVRYTYNGTPDSSYGKGNQAISNFGTLVLDGPTVENATEKMSHALFAIDTREGATFNIVDGAVLCANATAVRMGQFGADANEMTVEGGRIYGNRAVQVHLPSSSATVNPVMTLNVQGGVLESNDETYNIGVYVISNGQSAENVTVQIGGEAEIKGSVLVNAAATDTMNDAAIQITGGTIDGIYGVYSYSTDAAKADAVISVTGGAFAVEPNYVDPAYEAKEQDGKYVVVAKPAVAKIGEKGYWSLNAAVAAVQDGETITLVADETFTDTNYYNNGGWKDGLGYSGDKSFTIDLGGYTIKQDGSLNDYLVWLKNDGTKANTITFKNGTMDAGTTAYCALCTANSHVKKLTVNLENITLINNKSNGSTVKIRAGSVLNVNAKTKIIGKDSYLGIENWNAVVNIYDGAEIYMNGTTSYNGCLVGVGGNGIVNVYGGYGKGVSGGLIAMTSGGTINAKGGEWIANTDGTFANSNKSVLVAQSDKQYNAGAGNAVVNVTGGTYKGGYNCYGNAVGDAQINIKGGNFNANPETYVVKGYEAKEENGIYVVSKKPEATVNGTSYGTLAEAVAAAKVGETVTVIDDVTLSSELALPAGIIFNGNGKQINGSIYAGAEGNLTFAGHTKVTSFSASYYNRTITIGEGACLEVTGTGRVTLGYGNTFNITGSIENAKTADKANIQPSLIIPGGISITGGNDAAMNVTNAYVKIGNASSKNDAANGTFTLNIENSIAEFTSQLTFAEPTSGKNPTFNLNVKNSVLTTPKKLCIAAPNTNVVIDNSTVTLGTYLRNSGNLTLKNGSTLTGATIQFGENGGNNGTINVDASTLTVNAGNAPSAFDGKGVGKITAKNKATVSVDYYKAMTIEVDATSTFTGTEVQ